MKLFDKIKNVLFEEEEVELPIITKEKKEKKSKRDEEVEEFKQQIFEKEETSEIKLPDIKDKDDDIEIIEKDIYKSEPTFNFPLTFDEEVEEPRYRTEKNIFESKKEQNNDYRKYNKPEERKEDKAFTPSPVISPVYGVLDHNYKKEDIVDKKDIKDDDYEKIRKKAFGETIEQKEKKELEDIKTKTIDELLEQTTDIDLDEEIVIKNDVTPQKAIETIKALNEIQEEIDDIKEKHEEYKEIEEIKKEKDLDDTVESDLFELIDSMYENNKESED